MNITDWLVANMEWLFSGLGAALLIFFLGRFLQESNQPVSSSQVSENTNTNVVNVTVGDTKPSSDVTKEKETLDQSTRQKLTNILFVDDKADEFKAVSLLKTAGWRNTKAKKDLKSLNEPDLVQAHICFIDIHGVGLLMNFRDEGLGLARAIMDKYPNKKVIIYSAQSEGDRFNETLKRAHATLRKNADPYEFQNLVDVFSQSVSL